MSQTTPCADRQARIELLRTRAALERETLAKQVAQASQAWRPGQLLRTALSGLSGGRDGGSLLTQAMDVVKRYPLLTSTLPSLLLNRMSGRGIVRVATVGLAGWQLYKVWRGAGKAQESGAGKTRTPQ